MSNSSTEKNVIQIISPIIGVQIDAKSSAENITEWDSLAQMKIIIAIEKSFEFEIEDEWIGKLTSVASIVAYLKEKNF